MVLLEHDHLHFPGKILVIGQYQEINKSGLVQFCTEIISSGQYKVESMPVERESGYKSYVRACIDGL